MSEKEKDLELETAAAPEQADAKENMLIVFKKPYVFEKEEYKEIDLSCLEDLQASDMIAVNRIMSRTSSNIDVMPEVSLEYACNLAARATKKPVEFFMQLPPREAMRVKNRVMGFLFGSD